MTAYDGLNDSVIYDFETLGQTPETAPVLGIAFLSYSEKLFTSGDGYDYDELLDKVKFMKFDVRDQVKNYGCKIEASTLEWWKSQPQEAQEIVKPSPDDRSISELYDFMVTEKPYNLKKVYTRGNTFDPIFLTHIMRKTGNPEPYPWWVIRDTRSMIDGMLIGSGESNKFVPKEYVDKFIPHDPKHDIVMDVMRMQTLFRAILL